MSEDPIPKMQHRTSSSVLESQSRSDLEDQKKNVDTNSDHASKPNGGGRSIRPVSIDEADRESTKPVKLKPYQRLVTEKNAYNMSLWAMRLGVLTDSVNNTILRPVYPFLVTPGYSSVSFELNYYMLLEQIRSVADCCSLFFSSLICIQLCPHQS